MLLETQKNVSQYTEECRHSQNDDDASIERLLVESVVLENLFASREGTGTIASELSVLAVEMHTGELVDGERLETPASVTVGGAMRIERTPEK